MCKILKDEFQCKHFLFDHPNPEDFYTAQWRWHPFIYIAYRMGVACYSVACFLTKEILTNSSRSLAYLTIWTYIVLCLYQLAALAGSILGFVTGHGRKTDTERYPLLNSDRINCEQTSLAHQNLGYVENENRSHGHTSSTTDGPAMEDKPILNTENSPFIRWLYKLTWCLADIVYVFGIIVSLVYYIFLFPSTGITKGFCLDLHMHAFNSLQIFIDVAIVARPVRLLHFIYPLLYGFCYLIFNVIFWEYDRKNNVLYPDVLDWNNTGTTMKTVALLACLGIPFLQVFHFGLYRLRLKIYSKMIQ